MTSDTVWQGSVEALRQAETARNELVEQLSTSAPDDWQMADYVTRSTGRARFNAEKALKTFDEDAV